MVTAALTQNSKSQTSKKTKPPWLPIGLVGLAVSAGFFGPTLVHNFKQISSANNQVPFEQDNACALSSHQCDINGVTITLDTDIAKPLTQTQIQVSWPNNSSERLMLTLRGLEMDLGVVKFPLTKQADGRYLGRITLPICTEAKMTWVGTLTDNNQQTVYTSIRMEK